MENTIISNAPKTKGKTLGWAFQDGRKAAAAARKHGVEKPAKKSDK